jgi:hypothetical protein
MEDSLKAPANKRRKTLSTGNLLGTTDVGAGSVVDRLSSLAQQLFQRDGHKILPKLEVDRPAEEILDLSSALSLCQSRLEAVIEALHSAVERHRLPDDQHDLVSSSVEGVKQVVGYAQRLSYTTFAPSGFVPGQTPLGHFKPPAPQEAQFRASVLHQLQRE